MLVALFTSLLWLRFEVYQSVTFIMFWLYSFCGEGWNYINIPLSMLIAKYCFAYL